MTSYDPVKVDICDLICKVLHSENSLGNYEAVALLLFRANV